jgi:hypothetical protein
MLKVLDGYKTYLALAVGGAVLVLNHFGVQVPGVTIDDHAFAQNAWLLLLAAAGRHGIAKADLGKDS